MPSLSAYDPPVQTEKISNVYGDMEWCVTTIRYMLKNARRSRNCSSKTAKQTFGQKLLLRMVWLQLSWNAGKRQLIQGTFILKEPMTRITPAVIGYTYTSVRFALKLSDLVMKTCWHELPGHGNQTVKKVRVSAVIYCTVPSGKLQLTVIISVQCSLISIDAVCHTIVV